MTRNNRKLEEAILFFVTSCDHVDLTKLMKLLYYLDFDHFESYRVSVTGCRYRHLQYGPLPEDVNVTINALVNSDFLEVNTTIQQHQMKALRCPELADFTDEELLTLRSVAARWKYASPDEIVNSSRREEPWKLTAEGEEVPLALSRLRRNPDRHPENDTEEQLSTAERKRIINYIVATNEIEGLDLDPGDVGEVIDEIYSSKLSETLR